MNDTGGYKVKHPSLIATLISLILLMCMIIKSSILINTGLAAYMGYGSISFSFVALLLTIPRVFRKPFTIQLSPDSILLNAATIKAKEIKSVHIMGYFKPIIGIKLKNKRLVPYKLSFRFLQEEDEGIKELTAWAAHHQIQVLKKRFSII